MATAEPKAVFDVESVRRQFPALAQEVYGKPFVYLDSAASAQKPNAVIEAEMQCYREYYSNVHRGVHYMSQKATEAYEEARDKVSSFIGSGCKREVIFVRGTTEGINLIASTFGRQRVGAGDEVLITAMEHHSNIVPWQMLCEQQGAKLVVAPMNQRGELIFEEYERRLTERTKIVAFVHVSNALGTINPAAEMIAAAQERGIPTVVDGAQAAPHLGIDVAALGCDFYTLSGHKMFGPTGIGALYGKLEHLIAMPPYQGGGEMILTVSFDKTEYAEPPAKFEAGTPNIAGAIGFGAAVDFLRGLDLEAVAAYEADLLAYGTAALQAVPGLELIGTAQHKAAVLSFLIDGVHAHDVGTILDHEGIAVRAGHHCAQPVMDFYGVAATARASLALYNTRQDIDRLIAGIGQIREVFG
ncbi:MAG: cysteine desulfurase [Acidobacteria bacterium]|nr:cysteine desulfurase [Acidobacteriota bacterium]